MAPSSTLTPGSDDLQDLPDLARSRTTDDQRLSKGDMQKLSEALLHTDPRTAINNAQNTQHLSALVSPCYLHRRFDDAVDIEKVLEEIACDESMSHSKLVQTATGVREFSRQLQRKSIKRAVKNVMIVTKARDNELVTLTRELTEWLLTTPRYGSSVGVNVYVDEKLRNSKRFDASGLVAEDPQLHNMLRYWTPDLCWSTPHKFDLVLTLGGDGTVLFTSWLFQRTVPSILSFSLGSLGFLTPFDFQNYREDLNKVMGGMSSSNSLASSIPSIGSAKDVLNSAKFSSRSNTGASSPSLTSSEVVPDAEMRVNLRMRFTCSVHRAPKQPRMHSRTSSKRSSNAAPSLPTMTPTDSKTSSTDTQSEPLSQFEVLNEVVIDRGPSPYVSNLELYGDDSLLTIIQADGCIFSTPTGSTAYSLSAGGSLCDPTIPAILLTPICPHTLSFRPMLLNDNISLRVAVPKGSRAGAWCSFDGKGRIELRPGDYVNIRASPYPFASVVGRQTGGGWIDSVSRTLRWNTREARQKAWSSTAPRRRNRVGSLGINTPSEPQIVEELEAEDDDDLQSDEAAEEDEDFDIDFDEEESPQRPGGSDSGYGGETPASSASPASGLLSGTHTKLDKMADLAL